MSLSIQIDMIKSVLMGGVWYDVSGASFNLDSYEYMDESLMVHGGGKAGICATGFEFRTTGGALLRGPLTSIQAVSEKPMRSHDNSPADNAKVKRARQ